MRVNKYRPVWVKSPEAQRHGRLLTARATLQSQLVALENTIRGLLRQEEIGLTDRRTAFEAAVREAIDGDCLPQAALHPLLETRNAVLRHRAALDRQILRIVRADPVCRLLRPRPVSARSYRSPSRSPSTIPDGSRARATSGRILA
jgi:transposase